MLWQVCESELSDEALACQWHAWPSTIPALPRTSPPPFPTAALMYRTVMCTGDTSFTPPNCLYKLSIPPPMQPPLFILMQMEGL